MMKRVGLILIIATLFLASCSSAAPTFTASEMASPQGGAGVTDSFNAQKGSDEEGRADAPAVAPADYDASGNPVQAASERLVIQNANLTIVVGEPGETMAAIRRMAEDMGGFVVASNLYKTYRGDAGELPEATITVRVPVKRLNEALDQVKALTQSADDVKAETISGQDVTKEYTDLRSRLKNLEETEAQLREIMGSATKTEDVLSVYRELTGIREQIEVIKGQIQYYEEAAALSSIAVLIQAKASIQPLEIGGWQPGGVVRESIQALVTALQGLADIGIRLVLFVLPLALIVFFPLWLVWFIIRRTRKIRKLPVQS